SRAYHRGIFRTLCGGIRTLDRRNSSLTGKRRRPAAMNDNAGNLLVEDPVASEITRELAAEYTSELRRLSELALVFLNVTNGDRVEAEKLLDDAIDLLLEGTLVRDEVVR